MSKHRHVLNIYDKKGKLIWSKPVPVHDAKKDITVEVTQMDCSLGEKYDVNGCTHALAIRRHGSEFPHQVYGVQAYYGVVFIADRIDSDGRPSHLIRYVITGEDSARARANDGDLGSTPGLLHLKAPTKSQKIGGRNKRKRNTKSGEHTGKGKKGVYRPTREARLVGIRGVVAA